MKFWLTVVVGVMVVAAGSTALIVLSPNTAPAPKAAPVANTDPAKQPMAEVLDKQEVGHTNLAQHQQGQDVFRIRNASKTIPLVLTPMKPTCQCTDMFLSDREPSPSEKAPDLKHQRSDFTLKPGETGYVVARWDTKDKLGTQQVTVPVRTDDPRKFEIPFRISLEIHQEIVQSADRLEFGLINEGQKKSVSASVTSLIRDKFDIEKIELEGKGLTVKSVPMNADELKAAGVKSGYNIVVKNNELGHVGAIDGSIVVSLKTPSSTQLVRFTVTGQVLGDITTDPPSSTIEFNEITAGTYRPKVVRVFPRALRANEVIQVGTVKPADVLAATIVRDPNPKNTNCWNLSVSIKPNAPGGVIESGSISILDSSGKERLVFKVTGLVDPSFTHTAAR